MDFTKLFKFMASETGKNYRGQIICSYIIIALLVLAVIFILLVNHNLIMKKDSPIRRFLTHPLFYYSLKRIGSALVSIVLALAITFCLIRMQDLRSAYCPANDHLTPEQFERWCNAKMTNLGLTGSLVEQFIKYFYNIIPIPKQICTAVDELTGECVKDGLKFFTIYLGAPARSDVYDSIATAIFDKIPNSFRWGAIDVLIQIVIGYPLGIFMAKYQDKLVDKIGKTYIILIDAIPGLLYFYLLYSFFQQLLMWNINLFPMKFEPNNVSTWLAPAFTSSFAGIAGIAYWVRRYMLNEINSDYVKFARAKGLSENRIMFTHVLRNAIVPLSRSLSTAFISCLFGSYFIESLFSIDGFGGMLMTAVQTKDFMVVQGVVVFSAILSVISYLIADIAMAVADPRISFESQ